MDPVRDESSIEPSTRRSATRVPTHERQPSERDFQILVMRAAGTTLDSIGAEFGITRERARQIIKKHGGPTHDMVLDVRTTMHELEESEREKVVSAMVRKVLASIGPMSVAEISDRIDAAQSEVSRYWPSDLQHLRIWTTGIEQTWSDNAILDAIAKASVYQFPLTSAEYSELVTVGEVRGPSVALIGRRFGSWSAACEAAGVESGKSWTGSYQSRWTNDDLLDFARRYFADDDFPSSAHRYDEWKRLRAPDGPSAPTLRNRFGSWSELKRRAFTPKVIDQ